MSCGKCGPKTSNDVREKSGINSPAKIEPSELIETYNDFAKSTTNVIHQAASILEEEIAAGIVAAKRIEEHFLDVPKLRSGEPDEVMQRFRKDTHDLVDVFVDVATSTIRRLDSLSQNLITIRTGKVSSKLETMAGGNLPTISMRDPIKAGESADVSIFLENNSDKPIEEFTLYSTELVSDAGDRIPAGQIAFNPTSLKISSQGTEKVLITVSIPEGSKAGVYSGMVMATNMNMLRSVIVVKVVE